MTVKKKKSKKKTKVDALTENSNTTRQTRITEWSNGSFAKEEARS